VTANTTTPNGELTIQTLAMPADTNANGDIFGGWLVSQMDLAAGVLAKSKSGGRAATVAIQELIFIKPVQVGEMVSCYVTLKKIGNTSMTIEVEVWKETFSTQKRLQVARGTFIFVAIDDAGRPRQVPPSA
jgi:acyl-CoA thioesterase YciA